MLTPENLRKTLAARTDVIRIRIAGGENLLGQAEEAFQWLAFPRDLVLAEMLNIKVSCLEETNAINTLMYQYMHVQQVRGQFFVLPDSLCSSDDGDIRMTTCRRL